MRRDPFEVPVGDLTLKEVDDLLIAYGACIYNLECRKNQIVLKRLKGSKKRLTRAGNRHE